MLHGFGDSQGGSVQHMECWEELKLHQDSRVLLQGAHVLHQAAEFSMSRPLTAEDLR
jgi:hypothetical protein